MNSSSVAQTLFFYLKMLILWAFTKCEVPLLSVVKKSNLYIMLLYRYIVCLVLYKIYFMMFSWVVSCLYRNSSKILPPSNQQLLTIRKWENVNAFTELHKVQNEKCLWTQEMCKSKTLSGISGDMTISGRR